MTPNTRTLKGQSYCSQRWANPVWPKGSKSRGFSNRQESAWTHPNQNNGNSKERLADPGYEHETDCRHAGLPVSAAFPALFQEAGRMYTERIPDYAANWWNKPSAQPSPIERKVSVPDTPSPGCPRTFQAAAHAKMVLLSAYYIACDWQIFLTFAGDNHALTSFYLCYVK